MQGLLPGSVSKYCLQQSPIPVIVVRPSPKREKKKKKRLADPTRRSYNDIMKMSEQKGSRLFDTSADSLTKLPEEEAAAVAEAIGLPPNYIDREHVPGDSRETLSTKNGEDDDEKSPRDALLSNPGSPNAVVLKSPMLGDDDSPSVTENESDNEDADAAAQSAVTAVGGGDDDETPTNTGSAEEDTVSSKEPQEAIQSAVTVAERNDDETSPNTAHVEGDTSVSSEELRSVPQEVTVTGEEGDKTCPNTGSVENDSVPSKEADVESPSVHDRTSPTASAATSASGTEDISKDDTKNK